MREALGREAFDEVQQPYFGFLNFNSAQVPGKNQLGAVHRVVSMVS